MCEMSENEVPSGIAFRGGLVPLGSIQESGILAPFRTTSKGGKLLQGTPSKPCGYERMIHEFESDGIELEQCRPAVISTILESDLAFSWPTLLFRENQHNTGIMLSSLSDNTFQSSDMLAHNSF